MREPVTDDGGDPGITKDDLIHAFSGRIALIGGANIRIQQRAHFWQCGGERIGYFRRAMLMIRITTLAIEIEQL
jgi:hypothetical protein